MKKIRIPFLVVALSLTVTGMAFALDIPNITSWTQSMGVGGGGPGRGDVLIGALYDVRDLTDPNIPAISNPGVQIQQTLFSIVNTDPVYGVVARLRFREWKRSHECLDIDIPLSSNDVWVAELDNVGGVPKLFSSDYWISDALYGGLDPTTLNSPFTATPLSFDFPNGLAFLPSGVVPSVWGESGISYATAIARCQYGYMEVVGEERFTSAAKPSSGTWTINRLGTFNACGNTTFDCRDVQDVLMGSVYIIRPDQAISHQYNMNAISDFAVDSNGIWASTGSPSPNLRDQVQGELVPGNLAPNPGIGGINQLEAILSKRFVFFQYVNGIQGTTPMSTSVVLTLPTKWFHYQGSSGSFAMVTTWPFGPPFTGLFETRDDSSTTGGEICNVQIYDRDEHIFSVPGTTPVSPSEPLQPGLPHCPWEVNVFGLIPHDPAAIDFRNNVAIATANATSGQTFNSGWGWIDLSPNLKFVSSDNRTVSQGESSIIFNFFNNIFPVGPNMPPTPLAFPGAYRGLPGIGIVMTEFFNDLLEGFYGNTVPWQYAVDFGDIPCAALSGCGSGLPPDGTAFPGGSGY